MSTIPLSGLRSRHDDNANVKDFREYLMTLVKGGGSAGIEAEALTDNSNVVSFLKAASAAALSSSLAPDAPIAQAIQRLIGTNSPRSAFRVMAPSMIQVPMRTTVYCTSASVDASSVGEGAPALFRRLNISTPLDTETSKQVAAIAVSKEFADSSPEFASRILADVLSEAVARSTDTYFLSKVTAQQTADSGSEVDPTFAAMLENLTELLRLVKTGESSKLFFIFTPTALKYLASMAYGAGVTTLGYNGGQLMNVQCIASDSQTSGTVTLADASGIVYADEGIVVKSSDVAMVELDDAATGDSATPTAASVNYVSCFQSNTRAIQALQRVAVRVVARNCVGSLTNVQWGLGGGSPANL
jgi:hypothetical protein